MKPMGRFANLSSSAHRDPKQIKQVARGHKVPPVLVKVVGDRWGRHWERLGQLPETSNTLTILRTVEWVDGDCCWCARIQSQGHSVTCAFQAWMKSLT